MRVMNLGRENNEGVEEVFVLITKVPTCESVPTRGRC